MNNETFIHPESNEIQNFITELQLDHMRLEQVINKLFVWFDNNISYSRLNAPYSPLQRSDLDLLHMRCGTCGDYTNLIVSILIRLGYHTKYAYLKTDCYGDPQDHICAAVWEDSQWKLIDATNPYRKWYRFDCPHKEYELFSNKEFEAKLITEEDNWIQEAINRGKERYAGLLYAPWIHEEIIIDNPKVLETVFFLLSLVAANKYIIYVNYIVYSKEKGYTPIMSKVSKDDISFCFSIKKPKNMWDNDQWGDEYKQDLIPIEYRTERLRHMIQTMHKIIPSIQKIVEET